MASRNTRALDGRLRPRASQQDDSEQEDDAEQEDEDEARGDMATDFRKKLLRLRPRALSVARRRPVSPPKGYAFEIVRDARRPKRGEGLRPSPRWTMQKT